MPHFNSLQRAALTRILIDLIKADMVIAHQEIDMFNHLCTRYGISRRDRIDGFHMTMREAVEVLREAAQDDINELLTTFRSMTDVDGSCPREEALLMIALELCLDDADSEADVISAEINETWFDERQVLYVESHHSHKLNAAIRDNYRVISSELRLCGLEFVYLPHIISHYLTSGERELFIDVARMLRPTLPVDFVSDLFNQLLLFKTDTFCMQQLGGKLGIRELTDTMPAIILRINQSRVGKKVFTNFLRIPVTAGDVVQVVREFTDRFRELNTVDRIIISNRRDTTGAFLYKGFYRQLFEMLLFNNPVRASLTVNLYNRRVLYFADHDLALPRLYRKEKALYILFIYHSPSGGIRFRDISSDNLRRLKSQYALIYGELGGDTEHVPDIADSSIRNPILARISLSFQLLADTVEDASEFIVTLNREYQTYNLSAPRNRFKATQMTTHRETDPASGKIREVREAVDVPFFESDLCRRLDNIK